MSPQTGPALSIENLTVAYHTTPVLKDINVQIPQGALVGVVGPNGAGKSTLLKAVLNLVPVARGRVEIFGQLLKKQSHRVAYVPQRESVDWDFPVNVLDVVTMGLYRSIGWCRPVRKKHHQLAIDALEQMGIADLAQRQISQLSGGQQQRTFLARALVQPCDLYLMDEPFAAVDAATEQAIVQLLQSLRSQGKTVIVIHHDLETIPEYFDHVLMLNRSLTAFGETATTFTEANITKTYGGKVRYQVADVPACSAMPSTTETAQ